MTCSRYTESDLGRIKVVTSATRPTGASRYVGQRIYETDTGCELLYDGSGWVIMSEPEQTWSPSFASGVTAGNGVWSATGMRRSNGWCDWWGTFTLGSTTAVSGFIVVNNPVTMAAMPPFVVSAEAAHSGAYYPLVGGAGGTSSVGLYAQGASGTYVATTGTSGTIPFTWATGDVLKMWGRARMGSRYS